MVSNENLVHRVKDMRDRPRPPNLIFPKIGDPSTGRLASEKARVGADWWGGEYGQVGGGADRLEGGRVRAGDEDLKICQISK